VALLRVTGNSRSDDTTGLSLRTHGWPLCADMLRKEIEGLTATLNPSKNLLLKPREKMRATFNSSVTLYLSL